MCTWHVEHGADVEGLLRSAGSMLLIHAMLKNRVKMLEWLLQQGVSADSVDEYGASALSNAPEAVADLQMSQLLLAYGANVNLEGGPTGTPLLCAVGFGRLRLCKLLLDEGARPDVTWGDLTPVHVASLHENIPMCQLLVAHHAPNDTGRPLPHIDTELEGYVAAARDAGWKRRLPAFAAYVATHGVWWR